MDSYGTFVHVVRSPLFPNRFLRPVLLRKHRPQYLTRGAAIISFLLTLDMLAMTTVGCRRCFATCEVLSARRQFLVNKYTDFIIYIYILYIHDVIWCILFLSLDLYSTFRLNEPFFEAPGGTPIPLLGSGAWAWTGKALGLAQNVPCESQQAARWGKAPKNRASVIQCTHEFTCDQCPQKMQYRWTVWTWRCAAGSWHFRMHCLDRHYESPGSALKASGISRNSSYFCWNNIFWTMFLRVCGFQRVFQNCWNRWCFGMIFVGSVCVSAQKWPRNSLLNHSMSGYWNS